MHKSAKYKSWLEKNKKNKYNYQTKQNVFEIIFF